MRSCCLQDGGSPPDRQWPPGWPVGFRKRDLDALLQGLIDWIIGHLGSGRLVAAGHWVALGGVEDTAPAVVDRPLLDRLSMLVALTQAEARRHRVHGLSYEFTAGVLPELSPAAATGRTVVAHLGSGTNMCALVNGRSIATTMDFRPLSGTMGAR